MHTLLSPVAHADIALVGLIKCIKSSSAINRCSWHCELTQVEK
jgi:hypothetical protein